MGTRYLRLSGRPLPVAWVPVAAVVAAVVLIVLAFAFIDNPWSQLVVWVQTMQRDLHDRMAAAVKAVGEHGVWAAWGLVGLSFLYGVFHAVGPGHGKVVIATYMLTQESELRRGVTLSFLAALAQGIVAIIAVEVTVTLLDLPLRGAQRTAGHFETASYAAVLLLGLILVISAGRRLWRRRAGGHGDNHAGHHHHGEIGHDGQGHDHCGHSHMPDPRDMQAGASWRKGLGVIISIGLRPCSGAILVLLLAYALGLTFTGVVAVLAMSIGTALTVSVLAALAVYARGFSLRLAERLPESGNRIGVVVEVVALVGGLIVLAFGVSLLHMALTTPAHPLMMQ
ncbi:MAG: nickel/cobalt transporter [Pseudomonadota bacterium]